MPLGTVAGAGLNDADQFARRLVMEQNKRLVAGNRLMAQLDDLAQHGSRVLAFAGAAQQLIAQFQNLALQGFGGLRFSHIAAHALARAGPEAGSAAR